MIKIIHLSLLALMIGISAFAQDSQPISQPKVEEIPSFPFPEEEVRSDDGHFTMQLLQMFMMLGLLLGLLIFVSWFLKRMMANRIMQVNDTSAIKLLEQRAVSTKTTVYALDIEGKTYIFAENAHTLTPLYPITDK